MRTALLLVLFAPAGGQEREESGRWFRESWSISRRQGNGSVTHRVNSPDTAEGKFKDRPEARSDGKLGLALREDPADLAAAELYLELWGGHPGVANKTVTVNGKGRHAIADVGAAEKNCTYSYPAVPIQTGDLVRGENVFQFACEKGSTFWGHFLFEIACLRVELRKPPFGFSAKVRAEAKDERLDLSLDGADPSRIASVEYRGRYAGYDENGDGVFDDWHGMTKEGKPLGVVAVATEAPFAATWDLSMLPDQKEIAVRASVRFKDDATLVHATPFATMPLPARAGRTVKLLLSKDLPRPFWSRANRPVSCAIELDAEPSTIERAELHVAIWDGGRGRTAEPFTLNGHPLPVAGNGRHDLLYRVVPVDPAWLVKGPNEVRILADTEHHGIEVLLPGPALVIRARR